MKAFLLALLLLGSSSTVAAQVHVSGGIVAGSVAGLGNRNGVAADLSVMLQYRRAYTDLHVVSIEASDASRFILDDEGLPGTASGVYANYSAALDGGYVLPVYGIVSVNGGAGLRLVFDKSRTFPTGAAYAEQVYVSTGVIVGRTNGIRFIGRIEAGGLAAVHGRWSPSRKQVGVLVPLHR